MEFRIPAACAILAFVLASCDDSSSSSDSTSNGGLPGAAVTATSIVGLWRDSTSVTAAGHVFVSDQYVRYGENHAITLKVYSILDGSLDSSSGSGTWALKDGMLLTSLSINGDAFDDTAFATIQDNTLRIKSTDPEAEGEVALFVRATAIVPPAH